MDPVSHAVIGSAVAAMVPDAAVHPAVIWGILIGSEIPDADIVIRHFKGPVTYLRNHRGPTHGMIVLFLHALAISGVLRLIWADVTFGTLYLWTLVGCFSHVLFDFGNDYGTQGFWPFSNRWVAFDLIPIVDVYLLGLVGGGWLFAWLSPVPRQSIFLVVWLLIAAYVALRYWLRLTAFRLVTGHFGLDPECGEYAPCGPQWTDQQVTIHPTLLSLNAWRYVVRARGEYLVGMVWLLGRRVSQPERARNEMDKIVKASLQAQIVTAFAGWARRPRVEVEKKDGFYHVRWSDMRYEVDGFSPFTAHAWLDNALSLVDEGLGAQKPDKLDSKAVKRRLLIEMGRHEP